MEPIESMNTSSTWNVKFFCNNQNDPKLERTALRGSESSVLGGGGALRHRLTYDSVSCRYIAVLTPYFSIGIHISNTV